MKVNLDLYTEDKPSTIEVLIEPRDLWGLDHALAHIIHPALVALNKVKQGAPYTEDSDVPEHLQSTSAPPVEFEYETDDLHFARWDWIMQEMIWAFGQIATAQKDAPVPYKHVGEMQTRDNPDGSCTLLNTGLETIPEKMQELLEYNARVQHATMMFGKYYNHLFD